MKTVFLDTNVYIDALFGGKSHQEALRGLKKLISEEKIRLIIPEQVKYEFSRVALREIDKEIRNRDNVSTQALKEICDENWRVKDKDKLKKKIKSVGDKIVKNAKKRENGIKKRREELEKRKEYIEGILGDGETIKEKDLILNRAYRRYIRGNPPRKEKEGCNSFGDAVCWESLLDYINKGENLFLITSDTDYYCLYKKIKNEKVINPYLEKEWEDKKNSKVKYISDLAEFVNKVAEEEIVDPDKFAKERSELEDLVGRVSSRPFYNSSPTALSVGVGLLDEKESEPYNLWNSNILRKAACPHCGFSAQFEGYIYDNNKTIEKYHCNFCAKDIIIK